MIIIFTFKNLEGGNCRLSAVCGPSTTAAGAITILRARLSIPTEVNVDMSLENGIPIRHVTAPLTSLRKQRGGLHTQVLQLRLFAEMTGPASALAEINYAAAEVDAADDDEDDDNDDDQVEDEQATAASQQTRDSALDDEPEVSSEAQEGYGRHMAAAQRRASPVAVPTTDLRGLTVTPATARIVKARQISPGRSMGTTPTPSAAKDDDDQHAAALLSPRPARTVMALPSARMPSRKTTSPQGEGAARAGSDAPVPRATGALISPRGPRRAPATARPATATMHKAGSVGRVTKKNPNADSIGPATTRESPDSALKAASDVDEDDEAGVADLEQRVQAQQLEGKVSKGFVRRDIAMAHIIMREYPKLCENDPVAIATLVGSDELLLRLGYDTSFQEPSAVMGMSDALYARCLSIGALYGLETRAQPGQSSASAGVGQKVAFYGQLTGMRHSCRPTATVHYEVFTAPYAGSCRCARADGLKKGEEITFLYRRADSQAFLLLSKERRQNLLRRSYQFECTCERCKQTTNKVGDVEAKLTGVFFADSSADTDAETQKALSEEMRVDFDLLQLMDDSGVEITLSLPGNVPPMARTKQCNRLLGFIRKYNTSDSTLRLHDHHWRLNLARAAYIQETVRLCAMKGATPEARLKDPKSRTLFTPNKTVYEICLKQLVVERDFIPAGHPHQLTTFESFQYLMSILPATLAQSISRTAQNTSRIDWDQLQRTKEAWNVLKRAAAPPTLRRQIVEKSHN